MSYPALVNATDPAVTVTGSELPAGYTDEQIFVVTPSPAWHEVNSAGAETMIPLGSSGPFLVQIDDERILCSSFTPGGFTAVWWADPDSGRGYGETTIAEHAAGAAVTLLATTAQDASSGGGGSPNAPIVQSFPFTFDTPDLLTGATLFTPTQVTSCSTRGWKLTRTGTAPLRVSTLATSTRQRSTDSSTVFLVRRCQWHQARTRPSWLASYPASNYALSPRRQPYRVQTEYSRRSGLLRRTSCKLRMDQAQSPESCQRSAPAYPFKSLSLRMD